MNKRPKIELAGGGPVTPDHREIDAKTGLQKGYVVLTKMERAKGFVRPLRNSYVHKTCGVVTKMAASLAETYARDPKFYDGTFCVKCKDHFPISEFLWDKTQETVGS